MSVPPLVEGSALPSGVEEGTKVSMLRRSWANS
jgi:hypothetical protein